MKAIFTKESQPGLRAILFVILAITLMILDKHMAFMVQCRSMLSVPLLPLQYIVSWPINSIDQVRQAVTSHDALIQENMDLRAEQLLLRAKVQRLMALESENNQLKALLRSAAQVQGNMAVAQLLAIDTDPFIHQVVINKGSRDNVYVGQPVLDATGVLGQIIQTGPVTSRVLLINDPKSGVPVQNTRNGLRAIAIGDGVTGKLRLMNVPQTDDIRMGDIFITSGLGDNYPEGYPVGHVVGVGHESGAAFATVILEPDARLTQSRQVLLVWPSKVLRSARAS